MIVYKHAFFSTCYMSHPFQGHVEFITLQLHSASFFIIYLAVLSVTQTQCKVLKWRVILWPGCVTKL
jgi:hypothetical protein